jgi:hypothetical protein
MNPYDDGLAAERIVTVLTGGAYQFLVSGEGSS